jgi:aryl-alcohol dehydrogenase-like predicted oxidoreductase
MSEGYGTPSEEQSIQTLHAALECGIDFLDTSDVYGTGGNEEMLGRFLRGRPQQLRIATKFGLVRRSGTPLPAIDNSPRYVREACEHSLRRLGVETLDLYYAHRRDPRVPIEELVGALADLVRAGKVRLLGLSEVSSSTLRRAHAIHPIAAVQSEYSLCTRDVESGMLEVCRELGVTLVASCPLGRAFLTDTLADPQTLEASDFRRRLPRFQAEALSQNAKLLPALRTFASQHGATSAQIALAWLLSKYPHVIPIPGAKHIRHVTENARSSEVKLTAGEILELDELFPVQAMAGARYPPPAMAGIEAG